MKVFNFDLDHKYKKILNYNYKMIKNRDISKINCNRNKKFSIYPILI
jgi:hypothetical protein